MYDVTKLLPARQFDRLCLLLPTPKQKHRGRKRLSQRSLLNGILQVLVNDVAWDKIAFCGASPTSCWRYFNELQRRGKLKLIYSILAKEITNIEECAIDTTTTTSFRFKNMVGWDGKHKKNGTKISLLSDEKGLPADVQFGKGNKHDGKFVEEHLEQTAGRRKKILNLDKVYVSLEFRRNMRTHGTYINMETRKGDYLHKKGPKFRFKKDKYSVRFLIERLNGWIKSFRHIRIRRDCHSAMFKAFVYLALIVVLIRNV